MQLKKIRSKNALLESLELEQETVDLWLKSGAISAVYYGQENTYYLNEFDMYFFCKNYPTNEGEI